jgi:hypothetical protein
VELPFSRTTEKTMDISFYIVIENVTAVWHADYARCRAAGRKEFSVRPSLSDIISSYTGKSYLEVSWRA